MLKSSIRPAVPDVDFHGGRMLMPRQDRRRSIPVSTRTRAKKACTNCRTRKTKCTAETPQCADCVANEWTCVYEDNRKDRLSELASQKQLLVDLVHKLRLSANTSGRKEIEDTLNALDETYSTLPTQTLRDTDHPRPDTGSSSNGAPPPSVDSIADDINIIDFWAATYDSEVVYGQGQSEKQWPNSLHRDHAQLNGDGPSTVATEHATLNYALDASSNLPNQHLDIDHLVSAYEVPPIDDAYRLIPHYRRTVHEWIPIVPTTFLDREVELYYAAPGPVNNAWLTTLHLVFAIGARHAFLTNRDTAREREDIPYFSGAVQLLGLTESAIVTSTPDVALVQCYGLLALYYLTVHQIDRAWLTIGVALRFSIALNLHLKFPDNHPWPSKAEPLCRTWWSLRTLECFLCSVTGRPSSFPLNDCNVPLPGGPPITHYGVRPIAMLQVYIKITITTQWALSSLYTVKAATLPWKDVQDRVVKLKNELETLLPQIADRERLMLHFSWFDSMIMITRPCLAPWKNRDDISNDALRISQDMARHCVQAAQRITRLLPDEPDGRIYWNGPWWCLAHYIMRAMSIFLLIMPSQASVEVNEDPMPSVRKLIRWLQWMRDENSVAAQGLKAVFNTLKRGTSHAEFASIFEQEAMDAYGGGLGLLEDRWQASTEQPHFLSQFHALDDLLDSDGVINTMVSQSQPDALPMPPVYGNPYACTDSIWGESLGHMS